MKKLLVVAVVVLSLGVAGIASAGYWGPMMGWGGGYGSGPGYGYGRGAAYGMPCWGGYGGYQRQASLTKQDAEAIVGNYIGGNPNLKSGKIEDRKDHFETEILTKDNSPVSKLSIDKNTGFVSQGY